MTINGSVRAPLEFDPERHCLGNTEFSRNGKTVRVPGIVSMAKQGSVLLCRVKDDPDLAEWITRPWAG